MRWRRIAFWSTFGLFALIVSAISWLLLADLGSFKPQIERWASDTTGRTVSLNGDLQIDLARHSSVIANDIRISNADWAEPEDMISVGRLEVRLDLASILNGPIVIELIDLDDARIFLTEPEQGDPNWVLLESSTETTEDEDDEKLNILFEKIDIDRVQLTYSSPDRAAPIEINVTQLSQRHREDDFLDVSLDGTLNDRRMKLDGEVGTWNALLERKDVQFNLGGRVDTFSFSADGRIDDLLMPRRPRINFTAAAPDINDLLQALGVAHEGQGVIDLLGSLTPAEQGPLVLKVAGEVGRLKIEASGELSDLQDLEDVEFDLLASGEDIRPILEAFGLPQTKPAPFMINVDAARHGKVFVVENADMVFGQAKFGLSALLPDFPSLDDSAIELQIDGPDIERFREVFSLPGAATGPFSAAFTIDVADDGFELVKLKLETSLGAVRADGKLGDAPDYFGTSVNFQLKSPSLTRLARAYGVPDLPDAPLQLNGSVEYGADGIRSIDPLILDINDVSLKVHGLIKTASGLLGSDLAFELKGPNLARLVGAFATSDSVPAHAYSFGGQLQIRDDGYRIRGVTGRLGSSDVNLDGLLVLGSGAAGSHFNFAARGAAFTEVVEQLGDFNVRPGPYEFSGGITLGSDRIDFKAIELSRATAKINLDFELGLPTSRRWANLKLRASGPNVKSLMKGFGDFEANEAPFLVEIEGELREKTLSVANLNFNVGVANLSGQGTLDFDGDLSATRFDLSMNVPNISALGVLDGNRFREQSLTLNATVTGRGDVLQINDLLATLGTSDIKGDIEYRHGDIPNLEINIESDAIVLAPLLEDREPEYDPAPEFDDGRLIPGITIPFEAMAKLNASVAIDVGELQRETLHIRDVVLRASLQDGVFELSQAGFQAMSGAVGARGRLDPDDGQGSVSLEFVARDLALGMADHNRDLEMTGDVEFNIESTGNDLRSLFGNANGIFFLNTRGGRLVNNRFMRAFYGDMLDEIVGTINPFSKTDTHTDFECIIVPMEFSAGVVTTNPGALIATDKMRMVISPNVDLKSESLDVNIRTIPKKGIVISAGEIMNPYIKVVGTLAAPSLAVDEAGVLLSGGVAVATGGLSILARAAWNRLNRSKDPCADAAEKGIETIGDRFAELDVSIAQ